MASKPNDCRWLDRYMDCCRNTATHPNCWIGKNGDAIFLEPKCLRCAGCGYEPTTPETPAWDDEGRPTMAEHSPTPWRVKYNPEMSNWVLRRTADGVSVCATWQQADADFIAEAVNERDKLQMAAYERDRLRDIMRVLVAILETRTLEDHEIELLDEAREALEEDKE
jgi:hypothetical protein